MLDDADEVGHDHRTDDPTLHVPQVHDRVWIVQDLGELFDTQRRIEAFPVAVGDQS